MKKFVITVMIVSFVFILGCNHTNNDNYIEGAQMISPSAFSNITFANGTIKYETEAILNNFDNKKDVDYLQFFIPVDSTVHIDFNINSYDTAEPIILPSGYTSELQYFDESKELNIISIKDTSELTLSTTTSRELPAGLYFIKTYCDTNCYTSEDEFYSYTIGYEYDLDTVSINIPAAMQVDKEAIIWTNSRLNKTITGNEYLAYDIHNSDFLDNLFEEYSLYQRVYILSSSDFPDRIINTYFYLTYLYYYLDDNTYQKDYIDESFYDILVNSSDYSYIPVLGDNSLTDYGVSQTQINEFMNEFSSASSLEKLVGIINLRSIRIGSELVGSPSDYKEYISNLTIIVDALFTGMTLTYFEDEFPLIISGLSGVRNSKDLDDYCYMDIMKRYVNMNDDYILGDTILDQKGIYHFVCKNGSDGNDMFQNIINDNVNSYINEFVFQEYGSVTVLDRYERQ